MNESLWPLLDQKKLILCCGTGGVGKTTTAAALALLAATKGKRVGLITIDPAKRLATSLGLSKLSHDPKSLSGELRKRFGIKGELSALMLDSENAFYRFLMQIGGKEVHDAFKGSELFEVFAGNFGGTHDYLAMEKLYELHNSQKFDLLMLDTPPARHTLDFLDAPERIERFFDDRIFSWFLKDARSSSFAERLRAKGARTALSVLERLTGKGVIGDFVNLAPHIYKVKNSFVERQSVIRSLITSDEAAAVFISSPTDLARGEAEPFLQEARKKGVTVAAFVLNRSWMALAPEAHPKGWQEAPEQVKQNYRNFRLLVEQEAKNLQELQRLAGKGTRICRVPELKEDVHDLGSLFQLSAYLGGKEA
jgi:anion-transporting  ArsA/GET3 family ATPase